MRRPWQPGDSKDGEVLYFLRGTYCPNVYPSRDAERYVWLKLVPGENPDLGPQAH